MPDTNRTEQIGMAATRLWQAIPRSIQYVSDSANLILTFNTSDQRIFLRLTSARDRTLEQIEAELDFLSYLSQGGIRVSLPVHSVNGKTVEIIRIENESLLACAFQEATGEQFIFGADEANEREFRLRGQTLGRIHSLARDYLPPPGKRRFRWDEDELLCHTKRYLPRSEVVVWTEYDQLMGWLRCRPESDASFGLIHGDFGPTNYRRRDGQLTVFDFDDSCYHWFAYDLAVTIYPHGWRREIKTLADALLAGYSEQINDALPTREDLTVFCRLRQLYMFLSYAKRWGFTNLSDEQQRWFAQKRENIARGYELPI
jgi:Ser/Thr protein kinase RdoA (MazF antagonist)